MRKHTIQACLFAIVFSLGEVAVFSQLGGDHGTRYEKYGDAIYAVQTGIRALDEGIPLTVSADGRVRIQFLSIDHRTVTVEAAGFTTTADANGMTTVSTGPAFITYSPQPEPGPVGQPVRRGAETRPTFELRILRDGTGSFKVRIR